MLVFLKETFIILPPFYTNIGRIEWLIVIDKKTLSSSKFYSSKTLSNCMECPPMISVWIPNMVYTVLGGYIGFFAILIKVIHQATELLSSTIKNILKENWKYYNLVIFSEVCMRFLSVLIIILTFFIYFVHQPNANNIFHFCVLLIVINFFFRESRFFTTYHNKIERIVGICTTINR